ncbi:MAG: HPr kinase/phosphatase C-terminal domain-containing protein [Rhodospirillales bacterium]|nr:HPr kinase/phosphatase C-terminal domain-containing protein [Rhodospirillales bacterium]
MQHIRGTCIAVNGHGVLIRGSSGSGKSDLAVRLIDEGATLVADDYTCVAIEDGAVMASAPAAIQDLLEVRGLGILPFPSASPVRLEVVIETGNSGAMERLPRDATTEILGVAVPLFKLVPLEASATAKVRLAVQIATGDIIPVR